MENKLTLITPPDFYENNNQSILFLSISDTEQETVSVWLKDNEIPEDLNLYTYQGENNIEWLLYALARSDTKYINLDSEDAITNVMASYIISRPNVFWHTENTDLKLVLEHISNGYVNSVEDFLQNLFKHDK
jgi:hypothetical protein